MKNLRPPGIEYRAVFCVCRNEIFDYINDKDNTVFEQEPLRNLVNDREIMVFKQDGSWKPMETSRKYQFLNQLYEQKKAPPSDLVNTEYRHFKKNVLKTGDTSFNGSWLAYWLHQLGAKVYGFSLLPHCIESRSPPCYKCIQGNR